MLFAFFNRIFYDVTIVTSNDCYIEGDDVKYGKRADIAAFVQGITAAAIGALTGAVVVIARRSLTDVPTILITLLTAALVWNIKKIPEPALILMAAVADLVLYPLVVA